MGPTVVRTSSAVVLLRLRSWRKIALTLTDRGSERDSPDYIGYLSGVMVADQELRVRCDAVLKLPLLREGLCAKEPLLSWPVC
jgi:hypothetical protein